MTAITVCDLLAQCIDSRQTILLRDTTGVYRVAVRCASFTPINLQERMQFFGADTRALYTIPLPFYLLKVLKSLVKSTMVVIENTYQKGPIYLNEK